MAAKRKAIQNFQRYECKFLLNEPEYLNLLERLKEHMIPDAYCANGEFYTVFNLYFDTADNSIIRRSLEKPYYKEKLRLRSYSLLSSPQDLVFLELKKKIGGIVAKRRAVLSCSDALSFCGGSPIPRNQEYENRQVCGEIEDFLSRYSVSPKVFISYRRLAFFGKEDKELRISFDNNILTRRSGLDLFSGDYGSPLLLKGTRLMEIKCPGAMPLWLCSILSDLQIYRVGFSKYGTEYKQYITGLGHIAA